MRDQSTEWSRIEIKEYRTKDRPLRNTTGKVERWESWRRVGSLWRQRKNNKERYEENQLRAMMEMPNQLERR